MRSSDDDSIDDLERSLSCDGNQSDVRLQSRAFVLQVLCEKSQTAHK